MPDLFPVDIDLISGMTAPELLRSLAVDPEQGLTETEAARRLLQYGPNLLSASKQTSDLKELLGHFRNPLVIILLAAATLSFFLGQSVSGGIIILMVLVSVGIDFFLERDARNAAEALKNTVRTRVVVVREGKEQEILPEALCPGDVILLNAGRMVPADARVVAANDFFVNQSVLTGESFPNEKHSDPVKATGEDLTTLDNILFMGSSVLSGTGRAVVVRTGSRTEFGKVARQLVQREEESDFAIGLRRFGMLILWITLILVIFIFGVNALLKHNILESLLFSVAVAVGLTPELLPMVMSVTMSRGSLRMARKGAVVKKVMAIPNFGSMDVLCTDKTGTLTQDRIVMVKSVDLDGKDSDDLFLLAYLNSHFQTGIQNPLDDAVIRFHQPDITGFTKVDEVPFDFSRKRMSVIVKKDGRRTMICKGAPEEILKTTSADAQTAQKAQALYEAMSADGFRVLAIATREPGDKAKYTKEDETAMDIRGFIAFLDPPKEDARQVIAELQAIGVEVKIITGDNHLVTQKICNEIGLKVKGVMQGHELNAITDDALGRRAIDTTIFARFSPEQKNRVILALRAFHHAVGYMGDGINDAPSLRTADVGISVVSATDVAKDSADIILTQKDLLVLKEGILEGRKTFGNTMKYILMGLSSNFGNMFSVAIATLFLPFLPMLPVQILINNFLYDTSQMTIPTDNVDESYIRRPRRWDMRMIRNYMILFGLTSSVFDLATFYLLYKVFPVTTAQFRTGWFMESLATQIIVVFIIRTSKVPFFRSQPSKYLVWSTMACLAVGWLLPYLPFAASIGFEALPLPIIAFIIGLVLVYLVCAEAMKKFIYKRYIPED